jgi:hypothetical protein
VFGVTGSEALAGVVGPLIELLVLVALVYVAVWAQSRCRGPFTTTTPKVPCDTVPAIVDEIDRRGRALLAELVEPARR